MHFKYKFVRQKNNNNITCCGIELAAGHEQKKEKKKVQLSFHSGKAIFYCLVVNQSKNSFFPYPEDPFSEHFIQTRAKSDA